MRTRESTPIYFADFECTTLDSKEYKEDGHTKVYLWSISKLGEDTFTNGKTLDEFMEHIVSDCKTKIIYFHNLSYDGNFIYKWLKKNKPHFYSDIYQPKKQNYFNLFAKSNRYYYLEYDILKTLTINGKRTSKHFKIKFQCSYNLITSSVDGLGKALGMNKYDKEIFDKYKSPEHFYNNGGYHIWNNEEMRDDYIKYCNNDVSIVKKAYELFKEKLETHNDDAYSKKYGTKNIKIENILTIASLSQKLVKNAVYNDSEIPVDVKRGMRLRTKEEYEFTRNFYTGGLSQFNPKLQSNVFKYDGMCFDINSSYPFSMTKILPYGKLYDEPQPEWKHTLHYVEVDIAFAIKPEYQSMIVMKNKNKKISNERYLSVGSGVYHFLYEEYLLMKKIYNIIENKITHFYSAGYDYLNKFITKYYKLKQENSKNAFKTVYKLFLNSIYGSFAKKGKYPTDFAIPVEMVEPFKNKEREYLEIDGIKYYPKTFHNTYLDLPDGKYQLIAWECEKEPKNYPNMLVGATITAYSRMYLIENIIRLGPKNFIYCDTDSIFVKTNSLEEIKAKGLDIDDDRLGAWKMEFIFQKGKILGSKRYVFDGVDDKGVKKVKTAIAGVKKLDIKDFDTLEKLLNDGYVLLDGKTTRMEDEYGIVIVKRDIQLNEGSN